MEYPRVGPVPFGEFALSSGYYQYYFDLSLLLSLSLPPSLFLVVLLLREDHLCGGKGVSLP